LVNWLEGGWNFVIVLREVIGGELRRRRQDQGRTLREVSSAASVSLGYLSEVERGQKEASSELLSAICDALDAPLSTVLADAARQVALLERKGKPADMVRPRVVLPGEGRAGSFALTAGRR
jgi:transcriptional regulator with XRE-family HTH domain